ncbi:ACP S-malonyltransferase [Hydrogenimonas thermophila]|uniref:ACP S-malonyltransferase n=1 Tax=Hydrogenimonas thermophila TaxID=223786 RepID=UPI002936ECED|nr:ACP S-malonyltransferase [Hydrogenimonas thermophila]WOE70885.1 ACP S-malonyltransferase [Hydrogenimonas thermophila]WOE73403.1 ACP S-malonyltransferase [Hydrogenimonas thermophila]
MIKSAFLFPGQGSQAVGMGKSFVENSQTAAQMLEAASDALKIDIANLLFEPNDMLEQTKYTQPAILLVSMMAYRLFKEKISGDPAFALGHSLGEFSALAAVGAIDWLEAVKLVNLRGDLMQKACDGIDAGMMVVLGLADNDVEEICHDARESGKKVWTANYNADGQIVIAGIKEDLQALEPILKEAKARRVMLLNMSVASHCPLLESAVEPLTEALEGLLSDNFCSPVISNVTAKAYNTKAEAMDLLGKQLVSPVLYKQSIQGNDDLVDRYIEFGHGGVLKGLNRRTTKKPTLVVSDYDSLNSVVETLLEVK